MGSSEEPIKLTLNRKNNKNPQSSTWQKSYLSQIKDPTQTGRSINKHSSFNVKSSHSVDFHDKSTFHSRIDLLSIDMQDQIAALRKHILEQNQFLDILGKEFFENPSIDLSSYGKPNSPFLDKQFFHSLSTDDLRVLQGKKIIAVDGGVGIRECMGLDITLIKVAVVLYDFTDPHHPTIDYYPSLEKDEIFTLYSDLGCDRISNLSSLVNIRRLLAEISIVLRMLIKHGQIPDIIIFDGSIQFPPSASFYPLIQQYPKLCYDLISSFQRLYRICQEQEISLIGSVKDSKKTQFRDLLIRSLPTLLRNSSLITKPARLLQINYRKQLHAFSDYELLHHILPDKTRAPMVHHHLCFQINPPSLTSLSMDRTTSTSIEETRILSSLFGLKYEYDILYSYLRFSSQDLPLRFEMLCPNTQDLVYSSNKFKEIINILSPITAIEAQCTLPLPQIEAHLRAHLSESEFSIIIQPLTGQFKLPVVPLSIPQSPKSPQSQILATNPSKTSPFSPSNDLYGAIPPEIASNSVTSPLHPQFLDKRHSRLDQLF